MRRYRVADRRPRGRLRRIAIDDYRLILDLVRLTHEGPFEPSPWRGFLRALRGAVRADYAGIVLHRNAAPDRGGDLAEFGDADGGRGDIGQLYRGVLRGRGSDPLPGFALKPGFLYDATALLEGDDPGRDAFRDIVEHAALRWIRMARIVAPAGPDAWLMVTQPSTRADFTTRDEALLGAVLPFLAQSVRTFALAEAGEIDGEVAGRVARALGLGSVLIDPTGRIAGIDPTARRLLERRGVEPLRAGERLRFTIGRAEAELRDALHAVAAGEGGGPIVLRAGEEVDLLFVPLRARTVPRAGAPVAVLFVGSSRGGGAPGARAAILADLFGLTLREAELALHLAGGETLSGAAARLGITEQTARFYSKRIYAKTGVSGQGNLIRRVLTSVAMVV